MADKKVKNAREKMWIMCRLKYFLIKIKLFPIKIFLPEKCSNFVCETHFVRTFLNTQRFHCTEWPLIILFRFKKAPCLWFVWSDNLGFSIFVLSFFVAEKPQLYRKPRQMLYIFFFSDRPRMDCRILWAIIICLKLSSSATITRGSRVFC